MLVSYSVGGNTRWLQVGVLYQLARTTRPLSIISGIYSRVSSYSKWIKRTTKGAASLVDAPDPDDNIEEITRRINEVNSQINSLQTTVQSLQNNKTLLKQRIDEFKDVEGQDKTLQATENGILSSVSTVLTQ